VTTRSRKTFQQIVTLPDPAIPLAEAALLMACEEYPHLSLSPYLDFIDAAAMRVRDVMPPAPTQADTIDSMNQVLFDEFGFSGNRDDYYDPRNSFLNDVIERRRGIPISLSALYMAVGGRVGIRIDGIGLGGHFLVRHSSGETETVLDPFNRGVRLSPEALGGLASEADAGDPAAPNALPRASNREILARMLRNLLRIYVGVRAYDKALSMIDLMLINDPEALPLDRQRGLLRLETRRFEGAASDLAHYLRQQDNLDEPRHRELIGTVARIRAMLN
jgi:regulator of sirC expression with transglutaminase-like and TPR domain